jgi:hypothetical protein
MKTRLPHLLTTIIAALNVSIAIAQDAPPGGAGGQPPREPLRDPQPGEPGRRGPRDLRDQGEPDRPGELRPRDPRREGGGGFGFGEGGPRDRLRREQQPSKPQPYLGVITRPVEPAVSAQIGLTEGLGLLIEDLAPEGPAAKAGVQKLDVLKMVNDQFVANQDQLVALVAHYGKGADVTLTIVRKGHEQKITVQIGERLVPERPSFFEGVLPRDFEPREMRRRIEEGVRRFQDGVRPLLPNPPGAAPAPLQPGQPPPPAAGDGNTSRAEVRTNTSSATAKVMLKDDSGEIEVRSENGRRTLTAKNAKGETIYDGSIDTEEQRRKLPEDVRKKLEQVEVRTRIDQGPGGPGPADPFGPPRRRGDAAPEVQ